MKTKSIIRSSALCAAALFLPSVSARETVTVRIPTGTCAASSSYTYGSPSQASSSIYGNSTTVSYSSTTVYTSNFASSTATFYSYTNNDPSSISSLATASSMYAYSPPSVSESLEVASRLAIDSRDPGLTLSSNTDPPPETSISIESSESSSTILATASASPYIPNEVLSDEASLYYFQGCYGDDSISSSLTTAPEVSSNNSVEYCSNTCGSFAIFGVKDGSTCICILNFVAVNSVANACNIPCSGDATEYCGGSVYTQLYSQERVLYVSSSVVQSDSSIISPLSSSLMSLSSSNTVISSDSVSSTDALLSTTSSNPAIGPSSKSSTASVQASFTGPYTTVFRGYSGAGPTTITLAPVSTDETGTVIVETPTEAGSSSAPTPTPSSDTSFTGPYITIYRGYTGSNPTTITLDPDSTDSVGTVIVETPTAVSNSSSSLTASSDLLTTTSSTFSTLESLSVESVHVNYNLVNLVDNLIIKFIVDLTINHIGNRIVKLILKLINYYIFIQLINHFVNQLIDQLIDHIVNHIVNHISIHFTNYVVNHFVNHIFNHVVNHFVNHIVNHIVNNIVNNNIIENAPDQDQYDDYSFQLNLPFQVQLYTEIDNILTITTNGILTIGDLDGGDDSNINNPPPTQQLYSFELYAGTACMWWEDLAVNPGLDQGIYYQIDGDNTLSIEFIETVSGDTTGTLFHWIAQYKTTSPGLFDIYYFSDGDTGTDATVGIQGDDNDGNPEAVEYISGLTNGLYSGLQLSFDTLPSDTTAGTYLATQFNTSCYPPGTWPVGVC
ncbi:hypothetical protein MMC09_002446 [Bachmanniomyces sp. S44760]|nr:hypothetical protein [Bachmanniomyces sp. S44760]